MNLTQLIEEQKKSILEAFDLNCANCNLDDCKQNQMMLQELNKIFTTAITKGYELALEEVEIELLKAVASVTLHIQSNDDVLISLADAQNAISDTLAHLKETNK